MLSDSIVITGNRAMARSFAKINLTLDIVGVRENGYHNLKTIMQSVNLSDIIIVDKTDGEIKITTNKKGLPTNNKNIAYKACQAYYNALGKVGGAKILIHKNIPISAGLAGGSGNAAAVLASLNMLNSYAFSDEELMQIGSTLGADVPYCLMGQTQLAEGIGDVLTVLPPLPKCYVLLVTPPISISTPWAYKEFDKCERTIFPDNDKMIEALKNQNYHSICENLSNAFEDVTLKEYNVISSIKEKMLSLGADGAIMSGSGPTVFGLFTDIKKAKAAHDSLCRTYKDTYLTTTL
ncbi:MAG: 4-(cytidine 5'-diphospho)-2-C-methyl-D-erythritol kinase [Clostridia bacterium]|nr:4-(cytidine 5'-diphospho)-2-C-methyl-D-erythritol kinase [Clostridia bacterium]